MHVEIDRLTVEFDKQEYFLAEYTDYIQKYKIPPYERRLLRKWVSQGITRNAINAQLDRNSH